VGWFPLAPGEVFVPGYRVSRGYVNRVNITNTAVNVTKVSNVYNAVVINRDVNTMTYANRNVSGGVTVVSHDTFVNARPVARNVVVVPAKELASAPVAAAVAIEPARASVLGTGKLVANRPPAAVLNRPVVALRTPPPMPGSFDQRQAQAGGHLNQQSSIAQPLVRQEAPGRPVPVTRLQTQSQPQSGFRAFGDANAEGGQAKPQPRVWEAQGTPEPEPTAQTANRNTQSPGNARPAQSSSHPPARPVAPVQERSMQPQEQRFANSQPQRPATPTPPKQENSHPAKQQSAPAPKK
jgi:hypothetical protein